MNVRFLPSGDTALVVEFGEKVERGLSERVLQLSAAVRAAKTPGVIETVPTYRSLMILYDPLTIDFQSLISAVEKLLNEGVRETKQGKL
jgi:allophanate hydrolase subunit 1